MIDVGFNDVTQTSSGVWFQSFISGQQPVINTGANGLQRLDYVVKSAEMHGIKLIINFVNNWGDYGGMPVYNTYFKTTKTTWYTDALADLQMLHPTVRLHVTGTSDDSQLKKNGCLKPSLIEQRDW